MKTATIKQQKLIKLILVNLGNPKSRKSLKKLILEAGYSKAMAKNPQMIFRSETIKKGLKSFVNQLEDKRQRAITYITDAKLRKSHARDLAYITEVFTKQHQLLSGGATEKVINIQLSEVIAKKNDIDPSPE